MEQIDWSKAPEGATHFLPEQVARGWVACWYKFVDGTWFARNVRDCDWYPDHDYQEIFIPLLIGKPAPWSGTGLPPVGTVCELFCRKLEQGPVTVLYISEEFGVFKSHRYHHEQGGPLEIYAFKPIRTPEQIAAEQREKAINQMIDDTNILTGVISDRRIMAGQLYDAGYRKFEIVPE